jgi:hypothetical protein
MSRTRCSAASALTRVFDALWRCSAEPVREIPECPLNPEQSGSGHCPFQLQVGYVPNFSRTPPFRLRGLSYMRDGQFNRGMEW